MPLTFEAGDQALFAGLAGVSLPVRIRAPQSPASPTFDEDLLFTHRGLSGPAVALWGEYRVVLASLAVGAVIAFFYGVVGSTLGVFILLVLHAPEGLAQPVMAAILSRSVPEDAQGELQGGISAAMNLMMMLGTLFFVQIFARLLDPGNVEGTAGIGFLVSGALITGSLGLFLWLGRRGPVIPVAAGAGAAGAGAAGDAGDSGAGLS